MLHLLKISCLTLAIVVPLTSLQSQSTTGADPVIMYLTKGAKLKGDLIAFSPGVSSTIVTMYGDTVVIPEKMLKRVEYLNWESKSSSRPERPYAFREQGFYHSASLGLNANTVSSNSGGIAGYELATSFGYQHSRLLGVGVGISADFYHPRGNEMVFPIFAEVRGYFLQQPVTPYYSIRAGYGVVFKNEDVGLINGVGGYMINPAVGWRLSAKKGMNMTLDLGLKFQKAAFETFRQSERALTELTYKRLHVRLGFLF